MGWIAASVALLFGYLFVLVKRAGPKEIDPMRLARGTTIRRAKLGAGEDIWSMPGSRTTVDGMRVRFDADDDPQAEATFLANPASPKKNPASNILTVRLGADFETRHVHTRGHVFRVRLRGTGAVVGKEVRLLMRVNADGTPYGGGIENDDDIDAAVGDWIEFEEVEILRVR
jgi:hypothetical protein